MPTFIIIIFELIIFILRSKYVYSMIHYFHDKHKNLKFNYFILFIFNNYRRFNILNKL